METIRYVGRLYRKDNSLFLLLLANMIMLPIVLLPDFNFIVTEALLAVTVIGTVPILQHLTRLDRLSKSVLISCLLFFCIVLLYKLLGISDAPWEFAAGYYCWMIVLFICIISLEAFSEKYLKALEIGILIIVLSGIVYVTITGNRNMQFMDLEEAISQESAAYGSFIVLFSGICFIAFLHYKKLLYRILYLVAMLAAIYMNFAVMQRGTNVIFTVLMFLLIFIYRKKQHKRIRAVLFAIFVSLLFLYTTGAYIGVLDFLAEFSPSERVADRFRAINILLQTGDYVDAGSSIKTRSELTITSLNTFQKDGTSILFGIGDTRNEDVIGCHSEIIDTLPRYGLFGFMFLAFALLSQLKFFSKMLPHGEPLRSQVLIVFLIFILRNIIGNTLLPSVNVLLFLFLPIVCYFVTKQDCLSIYKQQK